jgi:hypothetical protein
MDLTRLLARLLRLKPRSGAAYKLRVQGEHALFRILQRDGLAEVERRVRRANAAGRRLAALSVTAPGTRLWREDLDDRGIQIYVHSSRSYKALSLTYVEVRVPNLTAPERERHAVQERFYERYMAIGRRAYADRPGRISAMERRLLLVGELEADVNNGGFSQYLSNKGPRRARAALAALEAIGAKKTAAMLKTAMTAGGNEAVLSALDERFYKAPEDLAVLAARHARL